MAATVDTHLFGSRRGYECLAKSSAVTAAEDRVLSEFGFGQNSDERFLQGLATRPTAFARPLPGGRIAITRVLNGPLDDGGRPTLERRTILVTPREYLALRHDLPKLIADTRLWSAGAFGTGGTLPLPSGGGRAAPASDMSWRIFDAWVSALERPPHGVVVGSDDISADAVLLVASQLADTDALRFSWGIRLLSPIAWVDVATLSPFGAMDGRRPVFGISQGDCVNEAVRRAQASSSSRLPSVDSLRARDVEPVEVRASGKAGPRRQVSGELDLHARAALRRRKLLLGIAALIVAACSLSVALYFAFSRPTTGGLGEQGFVNSGGGGAPFLPTQSESARPDTPPPSTTVSGSEAEKSTSPDPAETGAPRITLVPPKGTVEPSPSPTTDLDPVLPPPPPPLPPPPPPPPVDQPPAAEPQQPLLDLSQEDKRKVRGMIEWSTKVRGIQGVWDANISPLFKQLTEVIGDYNRYQKEYQTWTTSNHTNPRTAPREPPVPEFLQSFPEWEATWLTTAEDAVQTLGLSKNSPKLNLDSDFGKRYRALVQVRESDENQMSFVAEVMCYFIGVSTIYDLQSHAPPNASGWHIDFEKKRKTQLFKTAPFVGAGAKIDSIGDFIELRTALLKRSNVSVDDAARNFFPNDKKLARFKSFGDLYVEVVGSILPGNTFEPEFKNLQQEIDDLLKAFPAP